MGCVSGLDCLGYEKPVHKVMIARPFALSKYEVTFEDYDKFTYPNKVDDDGEGRGRRPVINVSWDDAMEYAAWLSGADRQALPSADGGGVGICGPRRQYHGVQLGERHRQQPGELL